MRLDKHKDKSYGTHRYSAIADDWMLFHSIDCENIKQAGNIERHIKRMKSSKYIRNLKLYPEISDKLLMKYKGT